MRILSVLFILILAGCTSKEANLVEENTPTVCDLDYSRYQATVTGYCQIPAADLPDTLDTINKRITIKPLDEISEVFWFNKQ